ncbi:MAG: hypothetical protein KatS3mg097_076 [Candidatus Parcubacteria bacterium]|nr:MAG: hypothetical protein KatS3mg097_076 [Candidatus Parcubacteria bacterium]
MFEIFYQDHLEFFKNSLNKHINHRILNNKNLFIEHILKNVIKNLDKVIAPIVCWQLYLDKSNNLIKGITSYERFQNFLKSRKNSLLKIYNNIDKIITNYLTEEELFIKQILEIVSKNWRQIDKIFNIHAPLLYFQEPTSSDRHYQGKRTIFLKFKNNKIIKIKPFLFSCQPLFYAILKKFNQDNSHKLKITLNIQIDNFWFSEFIPVQNKNINIQSAEIFYKKLGCLFALTFAFNGSDYHMENIIASKTDPVITDSETFFTNYSIYKNKKLINSLLSTGFIERLTKNSPTSAIWGGNKKLLSLTQPIIINPNTDKMRLKFKSFSKILPNNRIFKDNKILWQPQKFKKHILQSFQETYLWIIRNKENILNLIDNYQQPIFTRVILRKTSFYAILIQHILQPINLPLSQFKLKLKHAFYQNSQRFHNNYKNFLFKKIIAYEINNIQKISIPIFWQNIKEKHLYLGEEKYKNFFPKTAYELLNEKLQTMNNRQLQYYLQKINNYLSPK